MKGTIMNSYRNDQLAGFFFGVAAVCGITLIKLYSKYRKISKRIERHETFLAESEAWKVKYHNCPEHLQDEAIAAFSEILNRYCN